MLISSTAGQEETHKKESEVAAHLITRRYSCTVPGIICAYFIQHFKKHFQIHIPPIKVQKFYIAMFNSYVEFLNFYRLNPPGCPILTSPCCLPTTSPRHSLLSQAIGLTLTRFTYLHSFPGRYQFLRFQPTSFKYLFFFFQQMAHHPVIFREHILVFSYNSNVLGHTSKLELIISFLFF